MIVSVRYLILIDYQTKIFNWNERKRKRRLKSYLQGCVRVCMWAVSLIYSNARDSKLMDQMKTHFQNDYNPFHHTHPCLDENDWLLKLTIHLDAVFYRKKTTSDDGLFIRQTHTHTNVKNPFQSKPINVLITKQLWLIDPIAKEWNKEKNFIQILPLSAFRWNVSVLMLFKKKKQTYFTSLL